MDAYLTTITVVVLILSTVLGVAVLPWSNTETKQVSVAWGTLINLIKEMFR